MENNSFDVDLYFLQYNVVHSSVFTSLEVLLCVMNSFLVITGVVENSLLVLAIWRTSSLHSPTNMILCSLAISDFINSSIVLPLLVLHLATEIQLSLPVHTSTGIMWESCAGVTAAVSMISVVLLSLDRYLALRLHLRYKEVVTNKRVVIVIGSVWTIQGCVAAFRFIKGANRTFMILIISVIVFLVVCLFFTNTKVFQSVRRHQRVIHDQTHAIAQHNALSSLNMVKFRKTAITMFFIVGTFLLFYLPFNGTLVAYIVSKNMTPAWRMSYYVSATIAISSSAVNPIICWARMRDIRKATWSILPFLRHQNVIEYSNTQPKVIYVRSASGPT